MFNTNVESAEVWLQNFQQLHNKSNNFPQLEADVRCPTSQVSVLHCDWVGVWEMARCFFFFFFSKIGSEENLLYISSLLKKSVHQQQWNSCALQPKWQLCNSTAQSCFCL